MAKMSDVHVLQGTFTHVACGFPLRVLVRLHGCKVKIGRQLDELLFSFERREVAYYTHDASDAKVTYCPQCGALLPIDTHPLFPEQA